MKNNNPVTPPRWARRFLEWYCRPEILEDLQGDLNEYFERNLENKTPAKAKLIYVIDVFKFFRLYTIRKPKPSSPMNNLFIFQNYFKTSVRNLRKNKFFSTINIVGLAIAMVLGLLIITLLTEMRTFDRFHTKANRIYRLENLNKAADKSVFAYASTSLYAARKIKESVAGVEDVAILRADFEEDVRYENKIVPLDGLWANESFFNVFSFGLISGNSSTALSEPYSVVLTETSAMKIFGNTDAVGKMVQVDTANYRVTAVMKDIPMNSHLQFDMLGSFVTIDAHKTASQDKDWAKWGEMWRTYAYVLLSDNANLLSLEKSLARISAEGNKTLNNSSIELYLKPFTEIVFSKNISNSIGPNIDSSLPVSLAIFAAIVILSGCFNYTNLSIARALRRTREVGVRKVAGASQRQVFYQFMVEAIVISLISLVLSFLLFLLVKPEFMAMNNGFQGMVTLQPTLITCLYFIGLALIVGIVAGFLPAAFFSKMNVVHVLKDLSSVKLFKHVKLRKALIVFQYTLSLLFIVSVILAYKQYRYSLNYDLGFNTGNILEVRLEGNSSELILKEFAELHEVKQISRSLFISGSNTAYSANAKYNDPQDSTLMFYNHIDENYIQLHDHQLIAGRNFSSASSENARASEVIINEQAVKWMKHKDPHQALGEKLTIEGKNATVIGVVKDFNHNQVNYPIRSFAFLNDHQRFRFLNIKIESTDMLATMDKLQAAWKKVDPIHRLDARFHEEYIRQSYDKLSWMVKLLSTIGILAISIASLGLLGMVVFTTETRLKEISVRKVLGAGEAHLIFLLGKGFISLLVISSMIAIPAAYLFFDQVAFSRIVYRVPIGIMDLIAGALAVIVLSVILIGSQTVRAARCNPAEVLKKE
jgi:ABC-type antimicrobial peptide transport system permease subunit